MPSKAESYEQRRGKTIGALKQQIHRQRRAERMDNQAQAQIAPLRSSKVWQRLRYLILRRQPLCSDPFGFHAEDKATVPAAEVHHIRPAVKDQEAFFDTTNLTALCSGCHGKISAMERACRPVPACRPVGDILGDDP
jgi:5-methylcytosine-specific restriction endonuclease McrA